MPRPRARPSDVRLMAASPPEAPGTCPGQPRARCARFGRGGRQTSWRCRARTSALASSLLDLAMVNIAFYLAWFARYRLGLVLDLDPGNYVEHEVYIPLQSTWRRSSCSILGLARAVPIAARRERARRYVDHLHRRGLSLMTLFAASTFVRYPAESRLTLIFAWPDDGAGRAWAVDLSVGAGSRSIARSSASPGRWSSATATSGA